MATAIDRGAQILSFDYKHQLTGELFNRKAYGMVVPGIYKGGVVTITGSNTISIAPFTAFINSDDDKTLQVETTLAVSLTISEVTPIVYIYYEYAESIQNYVDFRQRADTGSPTNNEVTICKCIFSSGSISSINQSEQYQTYTTLDEDYNSHFQNKMYAYTAPTTQYEVLNLTTGDSRYLLREEGLEDQFDKLRARLEQSEGKLIELTFENSYILGRKSSSTDYLLDMFINEDSTEDIENASNDTMEVMIDKEWFSDGGVNWKNNLKASTDQNGVHFKKGFIRPTKQPYMLENIDEYNLEGIGLQYKCAISRYDTTNNCYWLMTNAGGNASGCIVKLGIKMKNGLVEEQGRWYLSSPGVANTSWGGIEVDIDNQNLIVVLFGDGTNGGIAGITINSNGTLGLKNTRNGGTFGHTTTPDGSDTYDYSAWWTSDVNYWPNDCTIWDSNDIGIIACDDGSDPSPTKIIFVGRAMSGGSFSANVNIDISGIERYITGNTYSFRSLIKDNDDLWVRVNDNVSDFRGIFKFDITTDVNSNKLTKCSGGRFDISRDVDPTIVTNTQFEGLSLSNFGDILEVTETSSNGKLISKRSLKDAIWAENQICEEYSHYVDGTNEPYLPMACMVEYTGGEYYYWTSDASVAANTVDIFRYKISDGTYLHARLIGTAWIILRDLTYNPNTDILYLLGEDGSYHECYYGDLSDFVALMSTPYDTNTTIDITSWGDIADGIGATNTKDLYALCYDNDNDILYILNETDDKIDTLSLDGVTWTLGVYDLPAPSFHWMGIAYKDSCLYLGDWTNTSNPNRIYQIDLNKSNSTAWYVLHMYQDPSIKAYVTNGAASFDFHGNDIVRTHRTEEKFYRMKILEDDDVLQLHSFLREDNVLLSNTILKIEFSQRLHEPEEFTERLPVNSSGIYDPNSIDRYEDIPSRRFVPDENYAVVTYGNVATSGMTILNLDNFVCKQSSTGKQRYDVRDIRPIHYRENNNTGGPLTNSNVISSDNLAWIGAGLEIRDDMIFVGSGNSGTNRTAFVFIDLKSGRVLTLDDGADQWIGTYFDGTLNDRNDGDSGFAYSGTYNSQLVLSSPTIFSIHSRTFRKEDQSDYNFENPKTFVAIGTYTGGCDLAIIDWDSDGNRNLSKVYNNIFNATSIGVQGIFIAPSGEIFAGNYAGSGNIYRSLRKVWEADKDACFPYNTTSKEIGTSITGGYVYDISPNSICWKDSTGNWRHLLITGNVENGAGAGTRSITIVDAENETYERVYLVDAGGVEDAGFRQVDYFEDIIYSAFMSASYDRGLIFAKKLHFDPKIHSSVIFRNGWTILHKVFTNSSTHRPVISGNGRPYFTPYNYLTATSTYYDHGSRFNKIFGIFGVNTRSYGVLFTYHNMHINECEHETIDIDCNNPGYYYFKQDSLVEDTL